MGLAEERLVIVPGDACSSIVMEKLVSKFRVMPEFNIFRDKEKRFRCKVGLEGKLKTVLITGINGSGGYYLAKYILENKNNVSVYGISRSRSGYSIKENDIYERIKVIECDMNDLSSLVRALEVAAPDLIFNMASNANVKASFETPLSILQNNIFSTANLLEAIRLLKIRSLVVHCSTSEVYGKVRPEDVPIRSSSDKAASPYAVSKTTQDMLCDVYFQSFDIPIIRTRCSVI